MGGLKARKLTIQRKLKTTTTNVNAERSASMHKSGFRVHKESNEGMSRRNEVLLGMFPQYSPSSHMLKPLGQLSGTRAAASAMAVEAGAAPDDDVPIVCWGDDQDSPWVDEGYNEDEIPAGISHAGGELTDRARVWFERAMRKYVHPSVCRLLYLLTDLLTIENDTHLMSSCIVVHG